MRGVAQQINDYYAPTMTLLSDFVSSERERFADEDNNKFALGFSQISRYHLFLSLILKFTI